MKIGIIDIGLGNVRSVAKAIETLGAGVDLLTDPRDLHKVDKIVFPGVGHFGEAVRKLEKLGFREELDIQVVQNEKLILGICLGMQLLGEGSQEGAGRGLSYVAAGTTLLSARQSRLPLPHVGWNDVIHSGMAMFRGIPTETSFYFVHSYAMPENLPGILVAQCEYGLPFAAAFQSENVWAAQFHPEKSQKAGLKLLKNFIEA